MTIDKHPNGGRQSSWMDAPRGRSAWALACCLWFALVAALWVGSPAWHQDVGASDSLAMSAGLGAADGHTHDPVRQPPSSPCDSWEETQEEDSDPAGSFAQPLHVLALHEAAERASASFPEPELPPVHERCGSSRHNRGPPLA